MGLTGVVNEVKGEKHGFDGAVNEVTGRSMSLTGGNLLKGAL